MDGTPFLPGWGTLEPTPGKHMEIDTMGRLWELLDYLHGKYDLTHIVWESIFADAKRFQFFGTQAQCNMEGVIMAFCKIHKIHGTHVTVNEWRADVYGFSRCPPHHRGTDGRAEIGYWKTEAIKWAAKRGYSPISYHDEAESLAILEWALTKLDPAFAAVVSPLFRRADLQQMNKNFRGES